MSLDKLIEKSKIIFPEPLSTNEVKDFFEYLAKEFIEVNYRIETRGNISKNGLTKSFNQEYISEIGGRMTNLSNKTKYASSEFSCTLMYSEDSDQNNITELNFSFIPGYRLEEHRAEEIKLWEKVKNLTQNYLSEPKPAKNNL